MRYTLVTLVVSLSFVLGCAPQVGDGCVSDVECSRGQICDTASPGGYCTRYECDREGCPVESACVEFESEGAVVVSACMYACESSADCRRRDGYICRDDIGPEPFCGVAPDESATP